MGRLGRADAVHVAFGADDPPWRAGRFGEASERTASRMLRARLPARRVHDLADALAATIRFSRQRRRQNLGAR